MGIYEHGQKKKLEKHSLEKFGGFFFFFLTTVAWKINPFPTLTLHWYNLNRDVKQA